MQIETYLKKSTGSWGRQVVIRSRSRQTSQKVQEDLTKSIDQKVLAKNIPRLSWSLEVLCRSHESRRVPASQLRYSTDLKLIG